MAATSKHLETALEKLDPRNLVAGLPGREEHEERLYHFLFQRLKIRQTAEAKQAKIKAGQVANIKGIHDNKTMFICGVPGTGKTATVMHVIGKLKQLLKKSNPEIHKFKDAYVNGQHIAAPERVYSEIAYQFTNKTMTPDRAQDLLDSIFKEDEDDSEKRSKRKRDDSMSVRKYYKLVIIDELDVLYSEKNQNVFYNLFDWPTSANSRLILIAIANAMDIAERFMRGRIQSRMGWEKVLFESYTSDCLQNIVKTRLGADLMKKCFDDNAVKLAAMRIGRSTGDARRILDTCRLALSTAIKNRMTKVNTALIDQVGTQNLDQQRINYIKTCRPLELFVLKAILTETIRIGEENVEALGVYRQVVNKLKQKKFLAQYNFIVGTADFYTILIQLATEGMIYLESEKPLIKKRLYIKDNSDVYKDLISSTEINMD